MRICYVLYILYTGRSSAIEVYEDEQEARKEAKRLNDLHNVKKQFYVEELEYIPKKKSEQ